MGHICKKCKCESYWPSPEDASRLPILFRNDIKGGGEYCTTCYREIKDIADPNGGLKLPEEKSIHDMTHGELLQWAINNSVKKMHEEKIRKDK